VGDVFQQFCDDLDLQDLAPSTRHIYRVFLFQYQEWLQGRSPDEATLRGYLAYLRNEKGDKQSSIATKYRVLRLFHEFLGQPVRRFRIRVKVPKLLPPFIHPREIEEILAQITSKVTPNSVHRIRDKAIISTFALSGMRLAELCDLKRKDVDLKADYIRAFGKGDKMRTIPINEELHKILEEYLASVHLKPSDLLFGLAPRTVKHVVSKYADLAGLRHIHPHSLRHFYASQLTQKGVPSRQVQELLGHASPSTTAIYQQVAPEDLRSAASKVSISGNSTTRADRISESLGVKPELRQAASKVTIGRNGATVEDIASKLDAIVELLRVVNQWLEMLGVMTTSIQLPSMQELAPIGGTLRTRTWPPLRLPLTSHLSKSNRQ